MRVKSALTAMLAVMVCLILPACTTVSDPEPGSPVPIDTPAAAPDDSAGIAPSGEVSGEETKGNEAGPSSVAFTGNGQNIIGEDTWDISMADIDADGDLDAYFGGAVWLNDGTGLFTETETSFGSGNAYFADFDGDGSPDIVYENNICFNDGKGNFGEPQGIPSGAEMEYAKPIDADGDGDLDLIVADEDSDTLLFNDGKGGFSDTGIMLGGWSQCRYAAGDIDGDGFTDIYVAIPHTPPPRMTDTQDKIWLGDGAGHFTETSPAIQDTESRDVIMADFDNDGYPDLFVADGAAASRILLNNSAGDLRDSGIIINQGYHATAAKAADFNNDGYIDILIANGKPLDKGQPNTLWLNDGTGGFSDSGLKLGESDSVQVEVGDFDGDGRMDAMIVNVDVNSGSAPVEVWLQDS